jgi:hypothetical protein
MVLLTIYYHGIVNYLMHATNSLQVPNTLDSSLVIVVEGGRPPTHNMGVVHLKQSQWRILLQVGDLIIIESCASMQKQ